MNLPLFQSDDKNFSLMQSQWRAVLNPIIAIPMLQGLQLNDIVLNAGVNVINTRLSRKQQGWLITDIDASSQLFRSAPFNSQTLTLTASSPCTVSLWVY